MVVGHLARRVIEIENGLQFHYIRIPVAVLVAGSVAADDDVFWHCDPTRSNLSQVLLNAISPLMLSDGN